MHWLSPRRQFCGRGITTASWWTRSFRFWICSIALLFMVAVGSADGFGIAVDLARTSGIAAYRRHRGSLLDKNNNSCRHGVGPLQLAKKQTSNNDMNGSKQQVEEYRNVATKVLSNFMTTTNKKEEDQSTATSTKSTDQDPISMINFNAPKYRKNKKPLDLKQFAAVLDAELSQTEWFVTGKVNPRYFADTFRFQDPDVTLQGVEAYARGVNKLFDQATSRAEIISTEVANPERGPYTITCTWRLSGKVNIGPAGLNIKPYIVYTDFQVDPESGLIVFQEDRFDIPSWDILLSAVFPFLIGKITAPPAPPVKPRKVSMPKLLF